MPLITTCMAVMRIFEVAETLASEFWKRSMWR